MTESNTPADSIERRDKRVWSRYNSSLVRRIDILMDTSFLNSWNDDLERDNDGKVGHPYKYPQEFFVFLGKMRSLWNVPFRGLEGFVRKLSELNRKIPSIELRRHIPSHKEHSHIWNVGRNKWLFKGGDDRYNRLLRLQDNSER